MQQKIKEYFDLKTEDMIRDIGKLIAIRSVKGNAVTGMPFGEGPAKAIECAQKMADDMGFITKNFNNYVLTIDVNDKPLELGIYCHLDVVHEGTGWDTNPYEMVVKDGKVFGRGTSDDKGPAISALYALKAAKDLGVTLKKNARLVLGADEECGSSDLEYYFKTEKPAPFGFSPDAAYPIYNVEKGGLKTGFTANYDDNEALPRLISVNGGNTINIVAQHANAVMQGVNLDTATALCKEYTEKTNVKFACEQQGDLTTITALGVNAHASTPQHGNNAVTALVYLLCAMPFSDSKLKTYLKGINICLPHGDFLGSAAGIKMEDEIAGELTCSFNILNIGDGKVEGMLDIRSPICANEGNVSDVLEKTFAKNALTITNKEMNPPHHVDENLPFIKTLGKVYEDYTGNKSECLAMGGGTYVHHIENSVAFGPSYPGVDTCIHSANEFAVIEQIVKSAQIYTQVIIDMCS